MSRPPAANQLRIEATSAGPFEEVRQHVPKPSAGIASPPLAVLSWMAGQVPLVALAALHLRSIVVWAYEVVIPRPRNLGNGSTKK